MNIACNKLVLIVGYLKVGFKTIMGSCGFGGWENLQSKSDIQEKYPRQVSLKTGLSWEGGRDG